MTGDETNRVLYIITCAAGPAPGVGTLIDLARAEGWRVHLIATPSAVAFLDLDAIEARLGGPVFSEYRRPDEVKRQPPADAAVVAPGTYNTINKWAAGIADNYALGTLAELTGQGVPIALLPCVNDNLAANRVYARSLDELREAGVRVLRSPRQAGEGGPLLDGFPWQSALDAVR
ncbi:flavoprotein [Streptacidiphilus albus]|uniref:flavoprotein n=1 Tax=Streptacidiphilus albus TaxID=105425 RepID=UPI00054BCB11|nr:flavoprotein [Streptacidiphilus albus]